MSHIKITTLDNGLRIITDTVPSVHSVALGTWVNVGTRDEDMQHNGVSHMVEHMLFKGTQKRDALQIVEEAENLGVNMNAYTGRDITSYHMHGLKDTVPTMIDVLADMYQNSTLPDEEIEREREVIIQEIGMTNDTPDDLIFDHYYETAYQNQALGAPILGTPEIIAAMSKETMQAHIKKHYTPEKTVIAAAGNIEHEDFVNQVKTHFNALPPNSSHEQKPASYSGGDHRTQKDLEQAHFMLGFEGLGRNDPNFYAVRLLATILGGGMSSRLFQEVREKRGLVYSIFAFHQAHQDSGQFGIYAGTGPEKLEEIMPVICDEILNIGETLTNEEIRRAKNQLKANLLMGRESMITRADHMARHILFRDDEFNPDTLADKIEDIDERAIKNAINKVFQSPITIAALGPVQNLEPTENIKKRLSA